MGLSQCENVQNGLILKQLTELVYLLLPLGSASDLKWNIMTPHK